MREIITLQFGQKANYLASHFWNTQESYFTYADDEEPLVDSDVLFRAGQAPDGTDTYTPRTVIYDLKGGFGSLRKLNALYDINDDSAPLQGLWDGATSTQHQQPIQPSRYQTLLEQGLPTFQLQDKDVRYWSDFSRVFYHPRSAIQLSQYDLNSQLMPFESWTVGEELFSQLDREDDLLDRDVRPFAEESDHMQGFHLIASADDAWGGYASKYLESLRDEYGKTSIWVWGIENTERAPYHVRSLRSMNVARSTRSMGQQASAYIRLATMPARLAQYVNLSSASDWMTAALLTCGVESATLPIRLRTTQAVRPSLSLLEDTLNTNGNQNIFELQMSIGTISSQGNGVANGAANGSANGHDSRMGNTDEASTELDNTLSPGSGGRSHDFARVETHRTHLSGLDQQPTIDPEERIRRRQNEETIVEQYETGLLFPLLDTFPDTLFRTSQRPGLELTAALSVTSATKAILMELRNNTARAFPFDEREALYNDLTELANNYSFGWDDGSDSGEDA